MGLYFAVAATLYAIVSNLVGGLFLVDALCTRPTYLAAMMSLSSGVNFMVLSHWFLVNIMIVGKAFQKLLFGTLSTHEVDHIFERLGYTLSKCIIAVMTVHYESHILAAISIAIFLALKIHHWILFDRIESLFQASDEADLVSLKRFLLNRVYFATFVLLYLDYLFISFCSDKYSHQPFFATFYLDAVVMMLDIVAGLFRVAVNVVEIMYLRSHPEEESYENKTYILQVADIIQEILNVVLNITILIHCMDTLTIFAHRISSCYVACTNLYRKLHNFVQFIKSASKVDRQLPDAVQSDFNATNTLCVICREEMSTTEFPSGHRMYPKKLSCSHIIHLGCLKKWLEMSQVCPMCRSDVFPSNTTNSTNSTTSATAIPEAADENVPQQQRPQWHNTRANGQPSQEGREAVSETGEAQRTQEPTNADSDNGERFFENAEHVLKVSEDALIPDDWVLFPINRSKEGTAVQLNSDVWADLTIETNTALGDATQNKGINSEDGKGKERQVSEDQ